MFQCGFSQGKLNVSTTPSLSSPSEMKQFLSNRRRDSHMNWFDSSSDWEQELERTGACGWRVSSVNDRFEMSTR